MSTIVLALPQAAHSSTGSEHQAEKWNYFVSVTCHARRFRARAGMMTFFSGRHFAAAAHAALPLPVLEPEPLPDFEALPLLLPDFLSSLGAAATPVAHSRRAVTSRMVDARIRSPWW